MAIIEFLELAAPSELAKREKWASFWVAGGSQVEELWLTLRENTRHCFESFTGHIILIWQSWGSTGSHKCHKSRSFLSLATKKNRHHVVGLSYTPSSGTGWFGNALNSTSNAPHSTNNNFTEMFKELFTTDYKSLNLWLTDFKVQLWWKRLCFPC